MPTAIQLKNSEKATLSNTQKTFKKLKKKIETLQQKLKRVHRDLDQCLEFYQQRIYPEKKVLISALVELVKGLYQHYKTSKQLTEEDLELFKELILDKIREILHSTSYKEVDPEIGAIFQDLEGRSLDEVAAIELENLKAEMQEMFEATGVDVDFSSIGMKDDEQGFMRKMFEAMAAAEEAFEATEEEEERCLPKNKKQKQLEQRTEELAALQNKEVKSIYKLLAKEFHPDLEQDPKEKIEKEELMKKLTCAYESNDLHALLLLKMERMNQSNNEEKIGGDEQLKVYNSILKNQVEELQDEIEVAVQNPKYSAIQVYLEEVRPSSNTLHVLRSVYSRVQQDQGYLMKINRELKGPRAKQLVQEIIQAYWHSNYEIMRF